MASFHHLHTECSHQFFQICFNRNGGIQFLIEYILVLLEVRFCDLSISVHKMADKIYFIDSHEPYVFVAKLCYVNVFNSFNYLVLENIVHGSRVLENSTCFAVRLIGLLAVSDCYICING